MVHKSKQFVSQKSVQVDDVLTERKPDCSFRSVRNFIIDLRRMPSSASATGLHWQVSQATSLMNIVVHMSTKRNTGHQGMRAHMFGIPIFIILF